MSTEKIVKIKGQAALKIFTPSLIDHNECMQVLGDFRLRDILCHDRSMTELRDMIRDMSIENFLDF